MVVIFKFNLFSTKQLKNVKIKFWVLKNNLSSKSKYFGHMTFVDLSELKNKKGAA